MSTSSINNLSNYLLSELTTALQNTGSTANATGTNPSAANTSAVGSQQDNGQLSPFAQLLSTLQQLLQTDPTKYQQVTQQISTNLQTAAQTAQNSGNTSEANQLNQLATDFSNASKNGQLPNIQDLAQAIGGQGVEGHHHGHHGHSESADSGSDSSGSSTTAASSSGTSQSQNQILAAFQAGGAPNGALNPLAIILNTLSTAGVTTSNS